MINHIIFAFFFIYIHCTVIVNSINNEKVASVSSLFLHFTLRSALTQKQDISSPLSSCHTLTT